MWWSIPLAAAQTAPAPTPEAPAPAPEAPATAPGAPAPSPEVPAPAPEAPAPAPEAPAPSPEAPAPAPEAPGTPPPDPRDDVFGAPDPRDDAFGAEPPPDTAPAPPPGRDEAVLGGVGGDTEGALSRTLAAMDDRFTIGGRLWLLTQGNVPTGADGPSDVTLDSPSRLDLYADARPNDRVRAYASGRLTHDFSVRKGDVNPLTGQEVSPESVLLDQLWTKFDVGRRVFVTVGKQRIRWGTGRFWNPSDFLNQTRLDPLAIFDVRTGVDLVKVHVPLEAIDANVYAIANFQDATALGEVGGALRAEWAVGQSEVTATASLREGDAQKLAATLSSGFGPFDLSLEGVLQHGVVSPTRWKGQFDPASFTFPSEVDRSDEWLPQLVARLEVSVPYGGDDSVAVGVEGFHNALGYDDARLLPWLFFQGDYVALYQGRDYLGGFVLLLGPGRADDHTFIGSVIANVSDGSYLARVDWRGQVLTWLEPNAFATYSGGANGELHFGYELAPQPLVPGLEDGIAIAAPSVSVGLGAVVRF